ncbi:carbamoyl phosphate synthase large subunit [Lederbergia wuyishanensis]|uniref:Carbamoyl phosphate synthase large chain n=1 Tax=Lederbergia wuyishanensis TaxID=1347903 RepID=A0ABU0D051_9BACI|nr:carbamoyl phosphate synthase large subunit [Lederbergia wuyishanensis]MCJ8006402.1 carbamoyl phosphate synthase large subunit [Lederbergia wuyishanensis]MDQ0341772.1 carbamoyl-phosphate synthase large subunit [Lederbergia wuyishanensis]
MPKLKGLKKVLVIGSGPIVIGQAAEFDYAGTQACMALKEEGIEVVLVNNNPATIMTDEQFADIVYFEPMTVQSITEIIIKERPDAILGTLGGQTGLNLTVQLYEQGVLGKYNVKVLGTTPESIMQGEDREAFRALMHKLGEPVPDSSIIHTVNEAIEFANSIGYPVIIRPAYTLGGGGGGIVTTEEQLISVVKKGLDASPITQCLIEKSIAGFKELEFEMIRDANDTCIAVCSMENFDPVGVHTGDSIVVAPQQTLTDKEYEALYASAVKIIRALKIIGGCNIQFAQDPNSDQYYLIEVNPRLSRSSALASKATGYPIAKIAAKLALGYHLHELINPVTGTTFASSEPVVDYTVVKMPRWPFDKFMEADRKLGTQMKATGEIMAIERHLPAALQKAVRSLEINTIGLELKGISFNSDKQLWDSVTLPDDRRFFSILELIRRGVTSKEIHNVTKIQPFFLDQLVLLVSYEKKARAVSLDTITPNLLKELKTLGFSDEWLAYIWNTDLKSVREKQKQNHIQPVYNMVDSCAGEFPAAAPYFYSTWKGAGDIVQRSKKPKIAIVGSGPVRIGQGIEFDYCTVHGVLALKKAGYEAILINNNPGTVSTDFQIADRLYFEPLRAEDVLNVLEFEKPEGVILQFGGQTSINLAKELEENGVSLLSLSQEHIDIVEDRERFYSLLKELDIPHIPGLTALSKEELIIKSSKIGYPLLLRPSYVIGGQGMLIIDNEHELQANFDKISYPVLIDAYFKGTEMEVDVLSDGENIFIPGFFEHIEKAGVHSGDSMAVTPPVSINEIYQQKAYEYTEKIAKKLGFKGIFNVQFVIFEGTVYVLEVNPRASRTVPIISKMTGVNVIEECINILTGGSIKDKPINQTYYAIKNPVFSTGKLDGVDPLLTPEMKSTGELIAFGKTFDEALAKAIKWNSNKGNLKLEVYLDVEEKELPLIQDILSRQGVSVANGTYSFTEWLKQSSGSIFLSLGKSKESKEMRMVASNAQLTVITEMETLLTTITAYKQDIEKPKSMQEWHTQLSNKERVI